MTSQEILERVNKNKEKLQKKKVLLEKKISKIEIEIDQTLNRQERNKLYKEVQTTYNYSKRCDVESIYDTIQQIADIKVTLNKQIEQLNKQQIKEGKVVCLPKVLQEYKQYLIDTWTAYDLKYKNFIIAEHEKLEYNDFIKKYNYNTYYNYMNSTKSDFIKKNTKDADDLILNLMSRVEKKVGTITDCSKLEVTIGNNNYSVINGYIEGTQGNAEVTSIEAGGYNIQKWHIRVLVK